MNRLAPALLALLVLVAGCAFVPTSPNISYTRVVVEVKDLQGEPVANARVEAWGGFYRTDRRNVDATDGAGRVQFSLPPADYEIYVLPPAGYTHVPPAQETRRMLFADPNAGPIVVSLVLARS